MSRSTITYKKYDLTGGTHLVRVVCGYLLKSMKENIPEPKGELSDLIIEINNYVATDFGFIRIEIPDISPESLEILLTCVSDSIAHIQSRENFIPVSELKTMQNMGFLLNDLEYLSDMPTNHIIDYLFQLRKMLTLKNSIDLSNENDATSYPIYVD